VQELKHQRFVAFVDNLVIKLGFGEVILGIPGNLHHSMPQSTDTNSSISSLSKAWVAGEILCTWTRTGGSVLKTFLPSLVECESRVMS
jgi:E3 ubiquitin-protein ligase listerin